jgi:tRNA(Ile)-lysidine synthase
MLPFSEKVAEDKMELRRKVEEAIRRERLLEPGMKVAVACSGGADSVALACLLAEMKEALGLRLLLVHLNHQLRGAEADADEAFVRQLAERLEVEFIVRREDVAARALRGRRSGQARREKVNLEEAGRQARLEFFASIIAGGKADAVALAHTLDDQAETVLGRLVRGAGTKGLAGIYPMVESEIANLRLVRPLLGVRRAELREYLAEREQAWREDASNLDRRRLRNRIRLELLPQLNPAAIEHLGRLAEHAREEESFWAAYVEERFRALANVAPRGDLKFEISDLKEPDPLLKRLPARRAAEAERAVARRLLRRALGEARGDLRRLTQTHVESVLRLAERGQSGQRVVAPGVEVEREFDRLVFRPAVRPTAPPRFELSVEAPGGIALPGGGALTFKLVAVGGGEPEYNERRQFVDAARAPFPLRVRNWEPGDAYQPLGTARVEKLKTLFRAQRVPREERARTPVVLSQGEIVWVPRLGVAAAYGLTARSRTALVIEERAE